MIDVHSVSDRRLLLFGGFLTCYLLSLPVGYLFYARGYPQELRLVLMALGFVGFVAFMAWGFTFPTSPARPDELPAELDYAPRPANIPVDWDSPAVQPSAQAVAA